MGGWGGKEGKAVVQLEPSLGFAEALLDGQLIASVLRGGMTRGGRRPSHGKV